LKLVLKISPHFRDKPTMKPAILILGLTLLSSATALPCSCASRPSVAEALTKAKAVFVGRCVSGKVVTGRGFGGEITELNEFVFEVTKFWKGANEKKQLNVRTMMLEASCGYEFRTGMSYVVYCYAKGDDLHTDICTRTRLVVRLDQDSEIKELDQASKTSGK
jgi:hypothetical protein